MTPFFWNIVGISFFDLISVYFAKFYSINKNPWFKEHIAPLQFLGIALTIIGLILIEMKK